MGMEVCVQKERNFSRRVISGHRIAAKKFYGHEDFSDFRNFQHLSGGVRVRFRVRFQAVKVLIFGEFQVENPTNKATGLKALQMGISLSEYG